MALYTKRIRQHAERMVDQRRAQNALASCLINMFPDPERPRCGFHAKFAEGHNRKVFDATLRDLGLPWGIPGIGRQEGLLAETARHVDNSQMKRLSQHAYSVRKLDHKERVATFLEVCGLSVTAANAQRVEAMVEGFISDGGPKPDEVDDILATEDGRIRPIVAAAMAEDVMHVWPVAGRGAALCGSSVVHSCGARLSALGYQLTFTTEEACSQCGAPVCPSCAAILHAEETG